MRAEPRSSTELVVTWEPPPRDMWHGSLQGYYVGYQLVSALPGGATAGTAGAAGGVGGPGAADRPERPSRDQYMLKTVEVGSQFGGEASLIGLAK